MRICFLLLPALVCLPVFAQPTPYSVAKLVHEQDLSTIESALPAALRSPEPLVRATAGRVVAVRGLTAQLPLIAEALAKETDEIAAREQIRALALLGTGDEVAVATRAAAKYDAGMDDALALSVARRGGMAAIQLYNEHLRGTRMTNSAEFFRVAFWGQTGSIPVAASRLIANSDARGWSGLLAALRHSNIAMHAPMVASSLGSPSEEVRSTSVWYLVRGYATDPEAIQPIVRQTLSEPRTELSTDREDFGRELLQRMLGERRGGDPRWIRFIGSEEADEFLNEEAVLQYLTDDEYALRLKRCVVQSRECAMPAKPSRNRIPSIPVAPPAFDLPSVLPPLLADAILAGDKCTASWIGVADATVHQSGRVEAVDLEKVYTRPACKRAIDTILRLSLATNTSMRSGFRGEVVLAHAPRTSLCLDEAAPDEGDSGTYRTGGQIQAPKVRKRVEPKFPSSSREAMKGGRSVLVIVESVVSRTGCVRNLRMLSQSPFGELNGAALLALSQWTFLPGMLDGKPVDVQFNLTINFKVN